MEVYFSEEDCCFIAKNGSLGLMAHGDTETQAIEELEVATLLHLSHREEHPLDADKVCVGSSFSDFLKEEGIFEEVTANIPEEIGLRASLHKFADEFHDWLIANEHIDESYEFGYWDHMWLSSLIAFWVEGVTKTYSCYQLSMMKVGTYSSNKKENAAVIRGVKNRLKSTHKVIDAFKKMAHGEDDEQTFSRAMALLKKNYRYWWD